MLLWDLELPGTDLLPQIIWAELNVLSHKPPVSASEDDSRTYLKNTPSFHEFLVFDAFLVYLSKYSENIHINSTWWQPKYSKNRILQLKTVMQVKSEDKNSEEGLFWLPYVPTRPDSDRSQIMPSDHNTKQGGSDQVHSFSPQSPELFLYIVSDEKRINDYISLASKFHHYPTASSFIYYSSPFPFCPSKVNLRLAKLTFYALSSNPK